MKLNEHTATSVFENAEEAAVAGSMTYEVQRKRICQMLELFQCLMVQH